MLKTPLKTKRLIINEFEISDVPRLTTIAKNMYDFSKKNNGYHQWYEFELKGNERNPIKTLENKAVKFLTKRIKEQNLEKRKTFRLAIRLKRNQNLIGYVAVTFGYTTTCGIKLLGDRGAFIDPKFSGHGYITEAAIKICSEFFKHYDYMDSTGSAENIYTEKLVKRLGGHKIDAKNISKNPNVTDILNCYRVTRESFLRQSKNFSKK